MSNIKSHFDEYGYVLIHNLISHEKIDNLLKQLSNFKKSNSIYYSQSEHN